MKAQFKQGTVILRHWDKEAGLNEIAKSFHSLDELFSLCLQPDDTLLVDRVVIDGEDSGGSTRTVTLVFQSTSMPNETKK
jgi:hypothetical protein